MSAYVSVRRNCYGKPEQPWFVCCSLCKGDGGPLGGIFGALLAPLGWVGDWQTAQDFAEKHARAHETTRCATCLHIPARALSPEDVSA